MTRFALLLAAGVSALTIASAAQAADLIIHEPAPVGVVNVSGNWDGAFIGVFGGGGWGELSDDFDGENTSGWLLGVDVGANFTVTDGIVFGVVGDIAWSNIENDLEDVTLDWTGSLRGRLGFDGGAFLPYLTAGAAFGGGSFGDVSNTHFGWTAGAGVEFAVTDNASIDLQYRFTDLASQDYAGDEIGFETHTVTAGLHWKF